MSVEKLKLETLHLVDDGVVAIEFDNAIKAMMADCSDRDHVEKERCVTLKVFTHPKKDLDGTISYYTRFEVECKVPKRTTNHYPMTPRGDGVTFVPIVSNVEPRDNLYGDDE